MVAANSLVVLHFDAAWDGYAAQVRAQLERVIPRLRGEVAFGYVDVDESADFASEVHVANVPSVAYFRDGVAVAVVIGVKQDIEANVRRVQRGQVPDSSNTVSRG